MNHLSTIIIQNELNAKEHLLQTINNFFPDLKIEGYVSRLENSKDIIRDIQPHLAIIDLDGESNFGFQFLKNLRRISFEIIFTSRQKDFALEAFKFSPVDYILKPLEFKSLKNSIQKARRRIKEKENSVSFENERSKKDLNNFLRISNSDGVRFINLDDIIRFEADGVYTKIFRSNGKPILSSTNLGKYEKLLLEKSDQALSKFYRIHHKHLVNLIHIEQFYKIKNSIKLLDHTEIKVAQRRLSGFKKRMRS